MTNNENRLTLSLSRPPSVSQFLSLCLYLSASVCICDVCGVRVVYVVCDVCGVWGVYICGVWCFCNECGVSVMCVVCVLYMCMVCVQCGVWYICSVCVICVVCVIYLWCVVCVMCDTSVVCGVCTANCLEASGYFIYIKQGTVKLLIYISIIKVPKRSLF